MNKKQQARCEVALDGLKKRLDSYVKKSVIVGKTDEEKTKLIDLTKREIQILEEKLGFSKKPF